MKYLIPVVFMLTISCTNNDTQPPKPKYSSIVGLWQMTSPNRAPDTLNISKESEILLVSSGSVADTIEFTTGSNFTINFWSPAQYYGVLYTTLSDVQVNSDFTLMTVKSGSYISFPKPYSHLPTSNSTNYINPIIIDRIK